MKTPLYYGYRIVAASFLIQAVTIGGNFAYGVLFKELEAEFGWSRAVIAGASSASLLVMGFMAVVAGRLNDKIGPRWLLTASALFYGLGYLLFAALQAPWQLYAVYGLLVGIGLCTHDVVTLSTVARWFTRRRGMASAVVKVGTGCGQLLVPLVVAALVAAFGWRDCRPTASRQRAVPGRPLRRPSTCISASPRARRCSGSCAARRSWSSPA